MPDPLANENVLDHLQRLGVDDGDPIRRTEGHERNLVIARQLDANRLDQISAHTLDFKKDRLLDLAGRHIDDRDRAADFR